jgi:hypothetical protein
MTLRRPELDVVSLIQEAHKSLRERCARKNKKTQLPPRVASLLYCSACRQWRLRSEKRG